MEIDMLDLADRYAAAKAQAEAIDAQLKELRALILATGKDRIIGERAIVEVALSERTALDSKAAKALLTADQIAACSKTSLVETIRIKVKI